MKGFCLLLVFCLLLSACGAAEEFVYAPTIIDYPPAASADFTLPDGYAFEDDTTASIIRSLDGQAIGGILDMGITEEDLEKTDHDSPTNQYLKSLGYWCEYISWNADGYKAVSLYITHEGAEQRWETSRSLFPRNGTCYDLWLEIDATTDEERALIQKTILG